MYPYRLILEAERRVAQQERAARDARWARMVVEARRSPSSSVTARAVSEDARYWRNRYAPVVTSLEDYDF